MSWAVEKRADARVVKPGRVSFASLATLALHGFEIWYAAQLHARVGGTEKPAMPHTPPRTLNKEVAQGSARAEVSERLSKHRPNYCSWLSAYGRGVMTEDEESKERLKKRMRFTSDGVHARLK